MPLTLERIQLFTLRRPASARSRLDCGRLIALSRLADGERQIQAMSKTTRVDGSDCRDSAIN